MAILYNESTRTFYLDGKDITYAFFINEYDYAEHLYFGKAIAHDDLRYIRGLWGRSVIAAVPGHDVNVDEGIHSYNHFGSELTFYGTGDYREPMVEVVNPSGDRLTQLLYDGHEILKEKPAINGMPSMRDGDTLVLHMKDVVSNFACDLYYTVYEDSGVIARRAVYKNESNNVIRIKRAYSFAMTLPHMGYDVISLYGCWAKERRIDRIPMHHGIVSIDSKRTSSSATLNPFLALAEKGSTEEQGNVYGISLIYSSSFVIKAEGCCDGRTLVTGGINDFDFSWKLEPGEVLETPEAVLAFSAEGVGGMSRCFHDAYRNHLINPRYVHKHRPLVINNWEATYFDFTVEKLKDIAKSVAGTGIDTFVLDDGWFGKRYDDHSGLGDWVVNTNKLNGGLKEIIDYVNSLGIKFGLWFEPEMVNEDSELYRAHPDWAIGAPNRPHCYSRYQFVLDLTREEVRDYIVNSVNKVLRENHIEYVKWDYNRNVTESYSVGRNPERQAEFAHRYALGLYDLCERIVEANPGVFFEGCSSGGARFDPGILYYFPQIWTSDDTDAEERTHIQYGSSMVYPLSSMSCHVSVVPNHQTQRVTPMSTRADIAHLGATGYELDTSYFTDEDRAMVCRQVEEYHEMEELILNGDLYRTENPMDTNYFGFMLVSKDKSKAVLTAYRRMGSVNNEIKILKVAGLDAEKVYHVSGIDMALKGATLMNLGIVPEFANGDFMTVKYWFAEI